jgi:hypothetical protein
MLSDVREDRPYLERLARVPVVMMLLQEELVVSLLDIFQLPLGKNKFQQLLACSQETHI